MTPVKSISTKMMVIEEIAEVFAFLASTKAAYCQGAIIDIDGGQTRTL
jgi:NAD(P)-dependent dehydrogenase (short-subunit alcohol dehydrogenase family)